MTNFTRTITLLLLVTFSGCPVCPQLPDLSDSPRDTALLGNWVGTVDIPSEQFPIPVFLDITSDSYRIEIDFETETGFIEGNWSGLVDNMGEGTLRFGVGCNNFPDLQNVNARVSEFHFVLMGNEMMFLPLDVYEAEQESTLVTGPRYNVRRE